MDPPEVIPLHLDRPPDWLCTDCEPILLKSTITTGFIEHNPSFLALQESATKGCGLCTFFYEATKRYLQTNGHEAEQIIEANVSDERQGGPCTRFISYTHPEERVEGLIDEIQYLTELRPVQDGRLVPINYTLCRFEIRVSLLAGTNKNIGGRVVPAHPDLRRCEAWIQHCDRNHQACRDIGDQELPTRIVDVGPPDGSQEPRLVISQGQKGRYIALSHRWGDPTPPRTTTININERLEGIAFHSLPSMFQDAVTIARKLGFRFIWIDSLCILQNDAHDWEKECPRMTTVYTNAAVTIAGPVFESSEEGLLQARYPPTVTSSLRIKSEVNEVDCVLEVDERPLRTFHGSVGLGNRAWVLQERLLSPRVLYFGSAQMYFECNHSRACEGFADTDKPLEMEDVGTPKNLLDLPRDQLYRQWSSLVDDYSSRLLSVGDDRLPALSGLASFMQQRLQDRYLAGLWEGDFINGLQWVRLNNQKFSQDPPSFQGPSWSWATCRYGVTYYLDFDIGEVSRSDTSHECSSIAQMKIVDLSIDVGDSNPFGMPRNSILKARGRMKTFTVGFAARWRSQYAAYSDDRESRLGTVYFDELEFQGRTDQYTSWRDPVPTNDAARATTATCLLVSSGSNWYPHSEAYLQGWLGVWVGLVLEKVHKPSFEHETFKRVGLMYGFRWCQGEDGAEKPDEVSNVAAYFDDAKEKTFSIV